MIRVTITIAAYRIANSPGICAFDGGTISTLSSVNNVLTSSAKICIAFKDYSFFDQMVRIISKTSFKYGKGCELPLKINIDYLIKNPFDDFAVIS